MCRIISLTVGCLLIGSGGVQAQERIPLPPPDSAPASQSSSQVIIPERLSNTEGPLASPYPPDPLNSYPPPYSPDARYAFPPRPIIFGDPVCNPRAWIGVDGLLWWSKSQPLSVPVITTGPASQGGDAGGLGMNGTTSLNRPLDAGPQGGMRIYAGGWLNESHTIGLDGSLFFLGQQNAGFGVSDRSGTGGFVINEPLNGTPSFITQVSAPGQESGSVHVNAWTQLGGMDLNGRYNLIRDSGMSLSLVGGFRYLQLDETLTIGANSSLFQTATYTDNMNNVLATAPPGSNVLVIDQFGTRNQFYGGQIGADFQYSSNRWFFGATGKLALGVTHQSVDINGSTTVLPVNDNPVFLSGGNYATIQAGHYSTNRFAVAPELQLSLGYQFTPFTRGLIGYNFLYLSSVARPGNQIDNTFDGVNRPMVPMTSSSFWAQGINFSLQFSY